MRATATSMSLLMPFLCASSAFVRAYNLLNADNLVITEIVQKCGCKSAHKIFFYFKGSTSLRALLDNDESEFVSRCDD